MKKVKKAFPKKAKLIANGFSMVVPLPDFVVKINVPVMRKISLREPMIDHTEMWGFELVFAFDRVYRGYAEYWQIDCIKVTTPKV